MLLSAAIVNCMSFPPSYIFEGGFQQEPVIQHAGVPSEGDSGESENAPGCRRQSGLSAAVGVSCLSCCMWLVACCAMWCSSCSLHVCPVSNPPERCLSTLSPSSLVVQLARDLQTDFYPHFPDFFVLITSLLETKDTELLEWAFTCLSYLYKYLWRLMVKDMSNIYRWENKMTLQRLSRWNLFFYLVEMNSSFLLTVYTAHCWRTRKSTSASLQQRAFPFWWERWADVKHELVPSFLASRC